MAWKRFLAVSCSHGEYADEESLAEVLRFKAAYKPHTVMHLGDALDFTALRAGANGTKDESSSLEKDFDAGTQFLERLEPTHFWMGNHEDRVTRLIGHHNAVISYAASRVMGEITGLCGKMHCKVIPYDNELGWVKFGDTLFGHGHMFSMAAIREHAEAFGKCVFGHLHRTGIERARTRQHATGYCVGWLGRKQAASYAKSNRSRLAWNNGYAHGEYNDKYAVIRIEERHPEFGWRSPL